MYKIRGADGNEYGPASIEELRRWIAEGRANAQTLGRGPSSAEWKPLGTFPELAGLFPPPAVSSVPPPYGAALPGGVPDVPNYLVQSILVTLCCCLPFGVVAIIFSAQVNSNLNKGDISAAVVASQRARMWCWIAVAGGVLNVIGIGAMEMFMGGLSEVLKF